MVYLIASFQSCKVDVLGAEESKRGSERLGNMQNTQGEMIAV